jgi:probable rRNA maturation factor
VTKKTPSEKPLPGGVRVSTRDLKPGIGVDPRTVRRRGEKLLRALDHSGSELSIVLCSDEVIRELNRTYRERDESTDVLAFPMDSPEPTTGLPAMLGDIAVSLDTAARQARSQGNSLLQEVSLLLIHGLLHLLGFDHQTAAQTREMEKRTRSLERVLKKRGKSA